MDHNKYKESMHEKTISTKSDENDAVILLLAYLNYFQCRTSEVAECTARYNVLRKMMITTVLAYLNYFQCKTTDVAEYTARYNGRKMMIVIVLAYLNYFQCQTTEVEECTARYNVRKMTIVTAPTYLNFLQNQSTEDARTITSLYALRNTKNTKSVAPTDWSEQKTITKMIDVTLAGSD